MADPWDEWKKGFDAWESRTAVAVDRVLRSPAVLSPLGTALSAAMRVKAASDRLTARVWSSLGLPTRRDQERTLHAINTLHARLNDLEDRLEDLSRGKR